MVAVNEEGKSQQVPKLILENEIEVRRFLKALKRKKQKRKMEAEYEDMKSSMILEEHLHKLDSERCVIEYDVNKD